MKETDTTEVVELLKSYAVYKNQIDAHKYARTYFSPYDESFEELNEEDCRNKMNFIKDLITSFAPSNMSTLLNLHYINGLSVEQCAECMAISRSSAFRLLRRAYIAVNNRYQRMKGE